MLFHPLLLPLYMLFVTFNSDTIFSGIPDYTQNMSYLLTLLGVTLLPLASLPLLKWLGLVGDYQLRHKHGDRGFPGVLPFPEFAVLEYRAGVVFDYGDSAFRVHDRDDALEDEHAHDGDRGVVRFCFYPGDEVFRGGD